VEKDGTYIPSKNPRLAYGTMVLVRAFIVGLCSKGLAQACVIATRYSAVRRQTEIRPGYESSLASLFECFSSSEFSTENLSIYNILYRSFAQRMFLRILYRILRILYHRMHVYTNH
jgi:hypothetical protein